MVTDDLGRQACAERASDGPRIRGRKAIVNGGSAGLGLGTALALAHEGVELYISARNEVQLDEACAAIRQRDGAKVEAVVADTRPPTAGAHPRTLP